VVQRQSNNANPNFTDEEVLTIYLFGLLRKRDTIKDIHEYAEDHFSEWFPDLPSYAGYVQRLNRLSPVFAPLTEAAVSEIDSEEIVQTLRIADSFPVMMAKEKRSSQATVAPQLADKGYCSSKNTFYYGVKLLRCQTARGGPAAPGYPSGARSHRVNAGIEKRPDHPPTGPSDLRGRSALRRQGLRGHLASRTALRGAEPHASHAGEENEGTIQPLRSRSAAVGGRQPRSAAHRVAVQLDRRENRYPDSLEGAVAGRTVGSRVRTPGSGDAPALTQPLIRIDNIDTELDA